MLGMSSSSGLMLAGMLSALVTTPLILHRLSEEAYGINIVVQQLIAYAGYMDFGFGAALLRRFGQAQADDDRVRLTNGLLNSGIIFFATLAMVLLVVGISSTGYIVSLSGVSSQLKQPMEDLLRVSLLLMAVQLILRPFSLLLSAWHRQTTANLIIQGPGIALPWLIAVFVIHGHGLYSFVYANTVTSICGWAVTVYAARREFRFIRFSIRTFDPLIVRDLFFYGKTLFVIVICDIIIIQSDRLITGAALSVAAVTALSLSIRIPEIGLRLSLQVLGNLSPHLMEYTHMESDARKLRVRYLEVFQVFMLITCCLVTALALTTGDFVKLWVGGRFFFGDWLLVAFLLTKILCAIHQVNGVFLNALGDVNRWCAVSCAHLVLHLVLCIGMARYLGIAGVVLGALVAQAATSTTVNSLTVCRRLGCRVRDLHGVATLPPLVVFSAGGALVLGVRTVFIGSVESWGAFSGLCAVTALVLGACGAVLIRRREFDLVDRYVSRLGLVGLALRRIRNFRNGRAVQV